MKAYDFVEISDIVPGDYIHINDQVMMVFALKVDLNGCATLTLLLPKEIEDGRQVDAVDIKFNIHEGIMRVNEYSDIEDDIEGGTEDEDE